MILIAYPLWTCTACRHGCLGSFDVSCSVVPRGSTKTLPRAEIRLTAAMSCTVKNETAPKPEPPRVENLNQVPELVQPCPLRALSVYMLFTLLYRLACLLSQSSLASLTSWLVSPLFSDFCPLSSFPSPHWLSFSPRSDASRTWFLLHKMRSAVLRSPSVISPQLAMRDTVPSRPITMGPR